MNGWLRVLLSMFLTVAAPACAVAEGWSMSSLNPFKKKDSHPARLRVTDDERPWWKPSLPTWGASRPKSTSSGPSTWTKMTRSTKSAWAKTKDALNPFDDAEEAPKSVTGYNTHFSQASSRKKSEENSSWWPNWGAQPKKDPKTVQDFIGQDRPEF